MEHRNSRFFVTVPENLVIPDLHLRSKLQVQFDLDCPGEPNVHHAQSKLDQRQGFRYCIAVPKRGLNVDSGEFAFPPSSEYISDKLCPKLCIQF